jgi:hypothetical protein
MVGMWTRTMPPIAATYGEPCPMRLKRCLLIQITRDLKNKNSAK